MKIVAGLVLIVIAITSLYLFAVFGTAHATELIGKKDITYLPFNSLGNNYPKDVITLSIGAAAFISGVAVMLSQGAIISIANLFLLNTLITAGIMVISFVGAHSKTEDAQVGAFAAAAVIGIVSGLVLLIFSLKEKPAIWLSIALGGIILLISSGAIVFSIVQGL